MEKPSKADCLKAQCGSKKFFCGRKHKFGLNLQGTCDAEGKFLDISIAHPASTSDFLAFATSDLQKQLEVRDFLAPGLCNFWRFSLRQQSFLYHSFQESQERFARLLQFLPVPNPH
jgi:DDE superfamily endonuclease